MLSLLVMQRKSLKSKAIITVFGVVMCVVLPQLFHILGAVLNLGGSLGALLLPMYLPVLFVGLFSGTCAGMICGALSPAISFALTGMPSAAMLPFMTIELAAFGFAAGFMSERRLPCILKVLSAQLFGRTIRVISVIFAVYVFGFQTAGIMQTLQLFVQGLPGIVLQLCLLPLIMHRLESLNG